MRSICRNTYQPFRRSAVARCIQTCNVGLIVALSCASLQAACTLDTTPVSPATRGATASDSDLDVSASNLGAAGSPAAEAPPITTGSTEAEPDVAPAAQAQNHASEEPTVPAPPLPGSATPAAAVANPMPTQSKNAMSAAMEPKSPCRPGKYSGVINGTISLTGLISLGTMAGTIDLRLVTDDEHPDLLVMQDGRLQGIDDNLNKFSAGITGKVKCSSGELVDIAVERGAFADSAAIAQVRFAGAAKGQYSMDPPALVGTWQVNDESSLLAGEGTWSASMFDAR